MHALTVLTSEIRQDGGLFYLNDLHKASGALAKHKPANFMRLETTQELMKEIRCSDLSIIPCKTVSGRGKAQGTYVCKELVYAYAMWISPKFHLAVIRAFDEAQTVVSPSFSMALRRWLISFDEDGREYARSVPIDAVVMTPRQFILYIGTDGSHFSDSDLLECIQYASERLKRRAEAREYSLV